MLANDNYGLLVEDIRARNAMARAQVALALTYKKLADRFAEKLSGRAKPIDQRLLVARKRFEGEAREMMTAYIRSSHEPVVRKMFGPPGELLYNEVRKSLDSAKRATLAVSIDEPDA
jgi:hypothetical protein